MTNYDYKPSIIGVQSPSDEYKRGWYDGYQAARRDLTNTQHYIPPLNPAICKGCGIDLSKATGYVCNVNNCPTKLSATVVGSDYIPMGGGAGTNGGINYKEEK